MEEQNYDPGALRHRLMLQQTVETSDGCGGLTTTWQDVGFVWAAIQSIDPRTSITSQQTQETTRSQIVIRFRDDVASGWRFAIGDRSFEITTLHDPNEQRRYLICQVEEQGR